MYKYILIATFFFTQATFGQTTPQKDENLIKAARTASNAAIANQDIKGIVECMMPNYYIITGRGTQVAGKDTVEAFWKKTFAEMPGVLYVRTPIQITISKNDTLAWETGKWVATQSYSGGGNYSAQWHKANGVWKTQAVLFVSLEK